MENSKTIRVIYKKREAIVSQMADGTWYCENLGEFTKLGSSITWLDDGRIPIVDGASMSRPHNEKHGDVYGQYDHAGNPNNPSDQLGRFPANLLVEDDVLNDGKVLHARGNKNPEVRNSFAFGQECEYPHESGAGDSGSYSRYFSLDAWAKTLPFLIVPKASKSEKNKGLEDRAEKKVNDGRQTPIDNAFQRGETQRKNVHPTVKPLKLMSYLITLGSRPGDLVVDPFVGSGTTGLAAKELGRDFIGFEREKEYVEIAEARLKSVNPAPTPLF